MELEKRLFDILGAKTCANSPDYEGSHFIGVGTLKKIHFPTENFKGNLKMFFPFRKSLLGDSYEDDI